MRSEKRLTPIRDLHDDDLVDAIDACRIVGGERNPIHPATLYRGIAQGRFDKPIEIGPNTRRWRVGRLRAAVAAREKQSDSAA